MAEIFSAEWLAGFQEQWNADPELGGELEQIGFSSVISYGYDDKEAPEAVIVVNHGKIVAAGPYNGEEINWDLRASREQWEAWLTKPPGLMAIGLAYTSRKLRFKTGDYAAMVKDPRMAGPFVRSFALMGQV
ncbi:MAG: SCP-2 sterol transfer family protein [Gammaproteobacteria bacterium]|nr:SCP-2 sterol transfer family protein [Gammaproteobacteria bacterium]